MAKTFYAHSTSNPDEGNWQKLSDHLNGVGELAGGFAAPFRSTLLAQTAGQLHDLGKYTDAFQRRLRGGAKVDHATWGARIACERYGVAGRLMAYGIAGHHAGLANGRSPGRRIELSVRLAANLPQLHTNYLEEISLPEERTNILPTGFVRKKARQHFQYALLTRMIFSCVVDADYLDTSRFHARSRNLPSIADAPHKPTLSELRDRLNAYLKTLDSTSDIDETRSGILAHVRSQARESVGVFSLTVPTGDGKTLTSLAFALDHAIEHGMDRIIFVIPFTSVAEQNAAVFKKAFGDLGEAAVIEHHSAFAAPEGTGEDALEKLQFVMDTWDAPVIVTTAVQFFESLYASKPARCRKLHNIANGVVIIDEAQAMPLKFLRPCVTVLDELALNYGTSVVMCTATQPPLNAPDFEGGFANVRELAPDPAKLFEKLGRVTVRDAGALDDAELKRRLTDREQVLCIVNNRKHAQALFRSISAQAGALHLSTLMYSKHRTRTLDEVRRRLNPRCSEPCRLVTTSLIEAGVDIDFPHVMRAEAGLDSIAQAAGRCNRNARRRKSESVVEIFSTINPEWAPPAAIKPLAARTREVMRGAYTDLLGVSAMEAYFKGVYWQKGTDELDKCNILGGLEADQIEGFKFDDIDQMFQMIDSVQMAVIIAIEPEAVALLDALKDTTDCNAIARALQPYLVQVPRQVHAALAKNGAIQAVEPDRFQQQFMQLIDKSLYSEQDGLLLDNPTLRDIDASVWGPL